MAYTMADFRRDYILEHFKDLMPEERQRALQGLPPEERLAGLPPEERLAGLPLEERLAGLSPEEIERFLKQLKAQGTSRQGKPRRKK